MKERPILFSGGMVRAILDGSKTQTRRVVKDAQPAGIGRCHWSKTGWAHLRLSGGCSCQPVRCPYGTPGDRLWVRETFAQGVEGCPGGISYRADHFDPKGDGPAHPMKWRPSIFMPRAASRILLEITDVRVQRLQEVSADDCRAEGHPADWSRSPDPEVHNDAARDWYMDLWQSINGSDSWHANPWVWAITFRRLEP